MSKQTVTQYLQKQVDWVIVPNFGFGRLETTTTFDDEDGKFDVITVTYLFPFLAKQITKSYRTYEKTV